MDFKDIIKAHLDKMAQQDFAFAERYKLESKSLDKCIQYIKSQAQKQAKLMLSRTSATLLQKLPLSVMPND